MTFANNYLRNLPQLRKIMSFARLKVFSGFVVMMGLYTHPSWANSPYLGTPVILPGTIQAENYDHGGRNVAYFDTSAGNSGGAYRSDDVDIEVSNGSGHNIGWTSAGEWLEYTIDVPSAGNYQLSARIASPSSGGGLRFEFSGATSTQKTINFSATGDWQNWNTTTSTSVYLNAGQHIVRSVIEWGSFNFDAFTIDAATPPSNGLEAYPGYTGAYNNFTLEIDDRFDSFDSNIWIKSTHTFYEPGCIFEHQGVQHNNGIMELTIDKSNNWKGYYCGEVRTKDKFPYGRIEARIKNPNTNVASGYISSLFTYVFRPLENQGDDTIHWRELDIEMEGGRPNKFQANLIFGDGVWQWWETGYWGRYEDKISIGPTSDWKVYALEWTEQHIRWFINGNLVKELRPSDLRAGTHGDIHYNDANIPEFDMGLYMNFWIPNDEVQDGFGGNKYRNQYPMKAQYDWFRYYRWTP